MTNPHQVRFKLELDEVAQQLAVSSTRFNDSAQLLEAAQEKVRKAETEMEMLQKEFERVKDELAADLLALKRGDEEKESVRKEVENHKRKWEEELRVLEGGDDVKALEGGDMVKSQER